MSDSDMLNRILGKAGVDNLIHDLVAKLSPSEISTCGLRYLQN
ncbi:hypothetical protein [Paenibacillus sp. JCM 10914]|nr:hypothetical protein [Paenibacillus sp. JCM 10914]